MNYINCEYEEQIWKTFYKVFNDDNENHCEFCFISNNLHQKSAFNLHLFNIRWVDEIGLNVVEKNTDKYPELIPYIQEYKQIQKNMNAIVNKKT